MPFHHEGGLLRRTVGRVREGISQKVRQRQEEKGEEAEFWEAKFGQESSLPPSQRKRFRSSVREAEEQAFETRSRAVEIGIDPTGKSPAQLQREILEQERLLAGEDPEGRKVQRFRERPAVRPKRQPTRQPTRQPVYRQPRPTSRAAQLVTGVGQPRIASVPSSKPRNGGGSSRLSQMMLPSKSVRQPNQTQSSRLMQAGLFGGRKPNGRPTSGRPRGRPKIWRVGPF